MPTMDKEATAGTGLWLSILHPLLEPLADDCGASRKNFEPPDCPRDRSSGKAHLPREGRHPHLIKPLPELQPLLRR